MVKGVARRVVVVKSPDPKQFEQAIFLLREDAISGEAPEEQVLRQAQQVANEYLRQTVPSRRWRFLTPALFSLAGALAASLFWFLLL
ncbi:MAG: translation initiation factor 2 [Ruminiclostridium sp.]|nr:translation initiation factor 2 [Ruminiclostridium sp.]